MRLTNEIYLVQDPTRHLRQTRREAMAIHMDARENWNTAKPVQMN